MRPLLVLSAAVLCTSCQTTQSDSATEPEVPLTEKTVGIAYADYVLETADRNRDGTVTIAEWTNAGGTQSTFEKVDANRDGVVTRTELVRISSNTRFLDFTRGYADFNKDQRLTPREFRSAAGVRLLRVDF